MYFMTVESFLRFNIKSYEYMCRKGYQFLRLSYNDNSASDINDYYD